MTPIQERVDSVPKTEGAYLTPGLTAFRSRFSSDESKDSFFVWAKQPVTRMVSLALKDLALNGTDSTRITTDNALVQYGVTMGLSLAAQMMDDPSLVISGLFGRQQAGANSQPTMDYSVDPLDMDLHLDEFSATYHNL